MGSKQSTPEDDEKQRAELEEKQKKGGDALPQGAFELAQDRGCSDILVCILFIIFWIGMVVVGIVAFIQGEPARLHNGYDFLGEVCGYGVNADKNQLYYPFPFDESPDLTWAVCMDRCPPSSGWTSVVPNVCFMSFKSVTDSGATITCGGDPRGETDMTQFNLISSKTAFSPDWFTYCADRVPICTPCGDETCCDGTNQDGTMTRVMNNTGNPEVSTSGLKMGRKYGFCFLSYPSVKAETIGGRCIPWSSTIASITGTALNSSATAVSNAASNATGGTFNLDKALGNVADAMSGPAETFNSLIDEMYTHRWMIAAAAGIALLLSLLYTFLLKIAALPLAMVTLVGVWVILAGSTGLLFLKAGFIHQDQLPIDGQTIDLPAGVTLGQAKTNQELIYVAAVVIGVIFAVYSLLLCVMIPRVFTAIKVINIASSCLASVPTVLLFPISQWIVTVILFAWWVVVMFYLAAAGEWDAAQRQYVWNDTTRYAALYHFFGLLWGRAFILAVGNLIVAGVACEWFLADDKKMLNFPLVNSTKRTVRYHLGTAAFGSFLIAVVQMIRWAFRYYMYQMKKLNPDNPMVKVLSCVGECCLWCLEKILNFINKNAYIQTAITGSSFCTSCKNAMMLLIRNCLRVGTLQILSSAFMLIGKYLIAGSTALLCALIMSGGDLDNVTEAPIFSTSIILLLAFCVASAFMDVWDVTIDAIFQCYCMDQEMGSGKSTGDLHNFVAENEPKGAELKSVNSQVP
mmetsp:Transcript_36954/g.57820  ORF Transcript_36954/g.57820 Transcript_36954/m.57820 type:complete len:744 (+) Transcript_36954:16-2247(+)